MCMHRRTVRLPVTGHFAGISRVIATTDRAGFLSRVKRAVVAERHAAEIEKLYASQP